jgi:hypothetical protein
LIWAAVASAALCIQSASAQCTGPFAGGAIPASGSGGGGAFPGTLPPSPSVFTAAVTAPGGATVLKSVKLNGLSHTWSGDVQFVLQDPAGTLVNLICGMPADPGNDFGGSYEIVDPVQCGTYPAFSYTNGNPIASGTYSQNYGGYTNGANGIMNVGIESLPAASGTWTLYAYDWVGGDVGTLTDFELCFGSPTPPPPPPPPLYPATSQCVTGGIGGPIPGSGAADGTWPTTLPTGAMVSSASITVPAGATKIVMVKLIGWSHTWVTDNMVVLTDPNGGQHLIYQGDDGSACGGCGDDLSGDYEFVDAVAGAGTVCTGGSGAMPVCTTAIMPPGRYVQSFGAWPSGSSGINNTLLESIPVSSGTWTLTIYDWCVTYDFGSLVGWDLCFDAPSCSVVDICDPALPDVTDGCTPDVSWVGTPDVTECNTPGPSDFVVTFGAMAENKTCNIILAKGAPLIGPWSTESSRCFNTAAFTRTGQQDTGGTGAGCTGSVSLDVESYLQAGNPIVSPAAVGDDYVVQAWYRDPSSSKTTQMSDAAHFTVCP